MLRWVMLPVVSVASAQQRSQGDCLAATDTPLEIVNFTGLSNLKFPHARKDGRVRFPMAVFAAPRDGAKPDVVSHHIRKNGAFEINHPSQLAGLADCRLSPV